MKRITFLATIAVALSSILWVSCAKEELNNSADAISNKEVIYKLDNIPNVQNEQNVIDLLRISQDSDDEKINFHLYSLSLALRELTKEKEFNELIIRMAKKSHNQCASLLDLKLESPKYFKIINANLAQLQNLRSFDKSGDQWDIESIAADLTHEPVALHSDYPETAETEFYYPAIFIPNLEIINPDYQPITSPNIEADPTKNEEIEDNVVAWYYNENGELNEILVNEETSLETTNPLFFLDNASAIESIEQNLDATPFYGMEIPEMPEDYYLNSQLDNIDFSKSQSVNFNAMASLVGIVSEDFRYEASGSSEFASKTIDHFPSTTSNPLDGTFFIARKERVIRRIGKNEFGEDFNVWDFLSVGTNTPWANSWIQDGDQPGNFIGFYNTYERDWNRSTKSFGSVQVGNALAEVRGRAKFNSEWYTWEPTTLQMHFVRNHWLDLYDNYNTNSWKSNFRISKSE